MWGNFLKKFPHTPSKTFLKKDIATLGGAYEHCVSYFRFVREKVCSAVQSC